ncbi:MAG: CAP domain-containing protein [Pseudomonadota bacterium]
MMKRREFLTTGCGAAGALVLSGVFVSPLHAASSSIVTSQALNVVNAFRSKNGRRPLKADPVLARAALDHSKAMAENGKLNHNRFRARLRSFGISGAAAENVAGGQPNLASVVAAWEKSRGHRRNMLGNYNRAGVAVARNSASGNRPYWTMILAR